MSTNVTIAAVSTEISDPRPALLDHVNKQRTSFLSEMPVTLETRRDRLARGAAMILAHRQKIVAAAMADFPNRCEEMSLMTEVFAPSNAFVGASKNLKRWMQPERRKAMAPFNLFGARSEVQYQPLGVVGIMGAWNAALNLVVVPMAMAMAAGNRTMLCPSDLMVESAKALDAAVREYFDDTEAVVCMGGLAVSKAFSTLPFDHLMFTGSTAVGTQVMMAAAANLVPVTLELGGKSPVIVLPDVDMDDAVKRLANTKTANGGQACIGPDHFYVPRSLLEPFLSGMDAALAALYPGAAGNVNYCGLSFDRHFQRMTSLVDEARASGGRVEILGAKTGNAIAIDPAKRNMAVHAVIDPPQDIRAIKEEIFGPVMIVSTYDDLDQACRDIRAKEKPLALYVFSRSKDQAQYVLDRTFSGGVTINDGLFHYAQPDLPFGGIGKSGIGAYSPGVDGFRRFSHARGVYKQAGPMALLRAMQPPYGKLFNMAIRGQVEKLARKYAGVKRK